METGYLKSNAIAMDATIEDNLVDSVDAAMTDSAKFVLLTVSVDADAFRNYSNKFSIGIKEVKEQETRTMIVDPEKSDLTMKVL